MQRPHLTIPGSPKAALEMFQRARQDWDELSPDNKAGSPGAALYSSVPAWPTGGSKTQRSLRGIAHSLRKSLSIEVGEHED